MANPEHLAILKKGVEAWNEWREKNPEAQIDLFRANLSRADLMEANLNQADLSNANLNWANLSNADLSGANLSNADLNWANLHGANLIMASVIKAFLIEAELVWAHLNEANLSRANLRKANLSQADLEEANLSRADLMEANLNQAHLSGANLSQAMLSQADLSRANLSNADLNWADLSQANLSDCVLGITALGDVDLSTVKGLETINHEFPSTIGIDTIYRSKGNIPEVFLRGCGVPEDMIAYARSLRGRVIDFYSCFISHSAKDKSFCERLYANLQAKGVRTWYFPEDAKWGETVWGEIDRSIKVYDKLVVVLSENSLQSGPVQREIERALNREDKEGKGILFPIRIDDYIFDHWEHERKADVLRKVVGDFSGWDSDAAKYEKALERLLKGLQAESAST